MLPAWAYTKDMQSTASRRLETSTPDTALGTVPSFELITATESKTGIPTWLARIMASGKILWLHSAGATNPSAKGLLVLVATDCQMKSSLSSVLADYIYIYAPVCHAVSNLRACAALTPRLVRLLVSTAMKMTMIWRLPSASPLRTSSRLRPPFPGSVVPAELSAAQRSEPITASNLVTLCDTWRCLHQLSITRQSPGSARQHIRIRKSSHVLSAIGW
jgi:hypothetical protein